MPDVFVSYVREDHAIAEQISRGLEDAGLSVWWDRHLQGGAEFGPEIERQLDAAKTVVVLWSTASRESTWVRDEAQQARDDNKLIPIRLDKNPPPLGFRQAQTLDFERWTGDPTSSEFVGLLRAIRHLVGGIAASPPPTLPRNNAICVLPFVNMSGESDQEYFSDGISEDIITDLSKVSALFVIARNTAFTFKSKSVEVTQVARQLNVSYVLEGSVRKAGGRVRITAQLIDGSTGGHLWAERYDRDLNDIFALQDEVSAAIVGALKLKLLPDEKKAMERRGTSNMDAYDLFLRGTRSAYGSEQMLANTALLEAAIRLAPDYADAWGALAFARALLRFERPLAEREELTAAAAAAAQHALALDATNPNALAAQYHLLPPFGRFTEAAAILSRMQAAAPQSADALAWVAGHRMYVGRTRDAIVAAQRAYELDPLTPIVANMRARTLWQDGRYADARRFFEDGLARWPDNHYMASNLLLIAAHDADWAAVDALLAPARLAQFPSKEFERWAPSYVAIMRDPSPASRRRPVDAARRQFESTGTSDLFRLQWAAELGFADDAYAIALRARFAPAGASTDTLSFDAYRPWSLFNKMFPQLRRDPRFVVLCARLGLVEYWQHTQQWPDCIDEVAPYYDFRAECEKVAKGPPLPPADQMGEVM